MTRINAGISPKELKRAHLLAEWREITMVPAALKRSLRTQSLEKVLSKIPKTFTLNSGHVTFFYDKMDYLKNRMIEISEEMKRRGWSVDLERLSCFEGLDKKFYNDWQETSEARKLVQERIAKRISEKPHLYKD